MGTSECDPTILIVDDQEGPRAVLTVLLCPLYRVYTAATAGAALKAIAEHPIDLVIADVGLPDYSGIELFRKMKVIRHDAKVIMMSGGGTIESALDAMQLGAAAYLLKPFNVQEVLALVQDALQIKLAE